VVRSATYAFGPERLTVERVGREYVVLRASGEVHEHRTYPTAQEATSVVIRLSNQLRRQQQGAEQ